MGLLSLFEISEIGHWILFVIWLLRFVISSPAKKQQDFITQRLGFYPDFAE